MKAVVTLLLSMAILMAGGFDSRKPKSGDFHIFTVNNKDEKISPKIVEEALKSNGFRIGQNANIQAELLHIFQDNNFKLYSNISFYHNDITLKLLNKHADAGILVPMGIVLYQGINEDDLHIVFARADMHSKIIGANTEELKNLEEAVLKVMQELFPTAIHTYSDNNKAHTKELLTKYALELNDDDFEDVKEELEENFEAKFAEAGFSMPSYFDLTEALGKNSAYDFYVTYAVCKMDVLRVVAKVKPEVAALGPCTTTVYKKKNEKKIIMSFASIYNWISSANIEDKLLTKSLLNTQREYENILKDVTKN